MEKSAGFQRSPLLGHAIELIPCLVIEVEASFIPQILRTAGSVTNWLLCMLLGDFLEVKCSIARIIPYTALHHRRRASLRCHHLSCSDREESFGSIRLRASPAGRTDPADELLSGRQRLDVHVGSVGPSDDRARFHPHRGNEFQHCSYQRLDHRIHLADPLLDRPEPPGAGRPASRSARFARTTRALRLARQFYLDQRRQALD